MAFTRHAYAKRGNYTHTPSYMHEYRVPNFGAYNKPYNSDFIARNRKTVSCSIDTDTTEWSIKINVLS